MSHSCGTLIKKLNKSIDQANFDLAKNMTDPNMSYQLVCIKPNITMDFYSSSLKKAWEELINEFIDNPEKCSSLVSNIFSLYELSGSLPSVEQVQKKVQEIQQPGAMSKINPEDLIFDALTALVMRSSSTNKFVFEDNMKKTSYNFIRVLGDHCYCQVVDIFKLFVEKYMDKFKQQFQGKTPEEVKKLLKEKFEAFKQFLKTTQMPDIEAQNGKLIEDMATKLTGMFSFSVGSELERLIPNELGSLKVFFVRTISAYFDNLHPLIWAQIFKAMIDNLFIELPITPDEIFAFVSKHLLLNAGPFILKILQMIRPVLPKDLATKYNLSRLTYPKLPANHVEMILSRVVKEWDMYKVEGNFSASVGHVCMAYHVARPNEKIIFKIIKPLAIAQSCWEYKTLYDIKDMTKCEREFLQNMLKSNGRELNVKNEIKNLHNGYDNYTCTYKDIYGIDIDVKLTTVQALDGIMDEKCWFAFPMSLAPGMPISSLLEPESQLTTDTKYRAKLHRCFDLLVTKFFLSIIHSGFYHGDLHSGNVFFSYRENQMSLIDFGAVGEIDFFENNPNIQLLLEVVVMSLFHNFDSILDKLTVLLNSKCTENNIDMDSQEYKDLKKDLIKKKYHNIANENKEKERGAIYEKDIFSQKRINDEIAQNKQTGGSEVKEDQSIYAYYEQKQKEKETVVENKDVLPPFTQIVGDSESYSFPSVLGDIVKFYALKGVNVAIKFSDFAEFQKAYALLLGVLHKVGYSGYRVGIAIKKAIVNWKNLTKIYKVGTLYNILRVYLREKNAYVKCGGKDDDVCEIPPEVRSMMKQPKQEKNVETESEDMKILKSIIDPNLSHKNPLQPQKGGSFTDIETEDSRILKNIIASKYTYKLTKSKK
ncbi:putative protein kinase [Klosneuvirus KNV1]|uniref:ABC1 atypical kinase-like domain-containing protein n=1 Tax=Klosneuvirus KNV1 TaxID=1977640 RepID=A0A1V0SID5_9VIRU|nr:putative protein kinase [Klosneuvirus KNV1]